MIQSVCFGLMVIFCIKCVNGATIISKKTKVADLCRQGLYSPENGQIEELIEEKPGVFSAKFKCNPGYRMVGQSKIRCLGSGKWVGRIPWCKSLCNFASCDNGKKCIVDDMLSSTRCVCKNIFDCPFDYKPICGSDHVTYANKCIMGMTACKKKQRISQLAGNACPKGIFEDSSCSECPRTRICPALYNSDYAFLGKLIRLNETDEGVFLHFVVEEIYKGIEIKNGRDKEITLYKKQNEHDCSCVPFIPSGKSYVFGKFRKGGTRELMALDEWTFVEKFYSHKQMSLCWLY